MEHAYMRTHRPCYASTCGTKPRVHGDLKQVRESLCLSLVHVFLPCWWEFKGAHPCEPSAQYLAFGKYFIHVSCHLLSQYFTWYQNVPGCSEQWESGKVLRSGRGPMGVLKEEELEAGQSEQDIFSSAVPFAGMTFSRYLQDTLPSSSRICSEVVVFLLEAFYSHPIPHWTSLSFTHCL